MRTIKLYGELGKRFGRVFRLNVRTTAEAIRALSANLPGFEQCLVTAESRGLGFRVKVDNEFIEKAEDSVLPFSQTIKIIPAVIGANAEFRIILGAALVVAGTIGAPITGGASTYLVGIGASLILGGVAQMLSPPPKSPGPREDPNNQPSYTFAGPVNTSAQGQCVPICFGQMLVGSAIVSAGITVAQIKSGYLERTRIVTKDMTVPYMASHPDEVPRNPISKTLLSRVVISIEFGTPIYLETYRFTYKETYLVEA
jgi:predicted phage tail protein